MRRLGLACAAIIALSACDRSPTPIEPTAETPAASSPDKPRTTAKPPKFPDVAKRHDSTGAANFVVHWVKVSNFAAVTGDVELLRELSEPDCEGCNRYIDHYERTYAAGGYFRGGDRQIRGVEAQVGQDGTFISGTLVAAPGQYRVTKHSAEKESKAEETKVTFLAKFDGSTWSMADIGLSSS